MYKRIPNEQARADRDKEKLVEKIVLQNKAQRRTEYHDMSQEGSKVLF